MAKIEVTISNSTGVVVRERFEITPDLAYAFLEKMEAMVASLPARARIRRLKTPAGATVVDIELTPKPPATAPTFQDRFNSPNTEE